MNDKDTFSLILNVISWYNSIPKDYSSIIDLLHSRKQLSTYSIELAILIGEERKNFESLYYRRKVGFAKALIERKEGNTVAIAEAKALQDIDELYKSEKQSEAEFNAGKILLHQVNEVLSTMNQHISSLKDEKKRINVTQPV